MPSESKYRFIVRDWNGIEVAETVSNFNNHLAYRRWIGDYIEEVKTLIRDPDCVLEARGGAVRLCRLGLGRGAFKRCWLTAIVDYTPTPALCRNFFFMRTLPSKEPVLEDRVFTVGGYRFRR